MSAFLSFTAVYSNHDMVSMSAVAPGCASTPHRFPLIHFLTTSVPSGSPAAGNVRSPLSVTHSAGADSRVPCWSLRPDSSWDDSELPSPFPACTLTSAFCSPSQQVWPFQKPPEGRVWLSSVSTVPSRSTRLLQTAGFLRTAEFRPLDAHHLCPLPADALKQLPQPGYVNSTARRASTGFGSRLCSISSGWIKW